jgi:hypothetical protein
MTTNRGLRVAFLSIAVVLILGVALWCPYQTRGVPEWRLTILDKNGNALVGAPVNQEWINPIEDGIVNTDNQRTDSRGVVTFPSRILRNRLALGLAPAKPNVRVLVCWQDQYGNIDWDDVSSEPPKTLTLKVGTCPYG